MGRGPMARGGPSYLIATRMPSGSAAKPWMFASPDEGFRPRSHSVSGAPALQFSATIAFGGVRHGSAAFTVTHGLMSPLNDPTATHTTNRKTTTRRSRCNRVRIRILETENVNDLLRA